MVGPVEGAGNESRRHPAFSQAAKDFHLLCGASDVDALAKATENLRYCLQQSYRQIESSPLPQLARPPQHGTTTSTGSAARELENTKPARVRLWRTRREQEGAIMSFHLGGHKPTPPSPRPKEFGLKTDCKRPPWAVSLSLVECSDSSTAFSSASTGTGNRCFARSHCGRCGHDSGSLASVILGKGRHPDTTKLIDPQTARVEIHASSLPGL